MSSIGVELTGHKELVRQLRGLGLRLRMVARKVASTAMAPVLGVAKGNAPIGPTGRLRASLGRLATTNRRRDAFTSRIGTRRDFTYKSAGVRMVSGRGKVRDKALAKGFTQDKKTAQQYARVIEFGKDSKGRTRRRAGPAHFLERAIQSQRPTIIGTVESELRRFLATPPTN